MEGCCVKMIFEDGEELDDLEIEDEGLEDDDLVDDDTSYEEEDAF